MEFKMGRQDVENDADVSPTDRLPMVEESIQAMKNRFIRMGFND